MKIPGWLIIMEFVLYTGCMGCAHEGRREKQSTKLLEIMETDLSDQH